MRPDEPYASRAAATEAFAAHVNRGKVAAFAALGLDLVMGEREGARFRDAFEDRWFYNCHCNGGVFNLGHRNPEVVAAVRGALDDLDIGNHHLVSGWRAALADRLAATTGGLLPGVVFGVGGGEANDLAIKLARAHTGRGGVVSAIGGYHGHTGLSLAAGDPEYRDPFGPNLPGFTQVPFDDLPALDAAVDDTTAAVVLEPVPATLGMPIPSPGYLAGVGRLCTDRGACLVLDEVQTGLGRTGTMWAFQQEGVRPDLVTTGKGLSGGIYPITATLMTAEIHAFFDEHPFVHISTFGGAELGCVAALATLDVIEAPGFLERVEAVGARFGSEFADLPFELRRRGLFMGLKFAGEGDGMLAARDADRRRRLRGVRQQRHVGAPVPPAADRDRRRGGRHRRDRAEHVRMIEHAEIEQVERAVAHALDDADASGLRVLGYGEISLVLGWPTDAPRWACKRLPPFPSAAAADRFVDVLHRYLAVLEARGVHVVETHVDRVALPDGRVVLYCVQPVLPATQLAPTIVAADENAEGLLREIVDTTLRVVDDTVGLDAQLSNWARCDGKLTYFDVTTPLLRGPDGRSELDTEVFLASLPWALRAPVRRFVLPGILRRYHTPRTAVLDLAANLLKERLDDRIPVVVTAADDRVDPPLSEDEVRSDYRSDARTWDLLQRVRRMDRGWQRRIRRRRYPFLLPDRIDR